MSITDELRAYAGTFYLFRYKDVREKLDAIADRIDAEHEKALDERDNERFNALMDARDMGVNAVLKGPEGFGLVALPKDADGKVIHIGDVVVEDGCGVPYKVMSLKLFDDCWDVGEYGMNPNLCRHYHEPTVEDVLRGVVELCHNTWKEGSAFEFYDVDDVMKSGNIADFAAKLRLAGDAE